MKTNVMYAFDWRKLHFNQFNVWFVGKYQDSEMTDRIRFIGQRADVSRILAAGDICPSLERMALEFPIAEFQRELGSTQFKRDPLPGRVARRMVRSAGEPGTAGCRRIEGHYFTCFFQHTANQTPLTSLSSNE